jgi:hypothetical protein
MTIQETGEPAVPIDHGAKASDSGSLTARARDTLKTIFYNRRWSDFARDVNYATPPFVTALGFGILIMIAIADVSVQRFPLSDIPSLPLSSPEHPMADFLPVTFPQ